MCVCVFSGKFSIHPYWQIFLPLAQKDDQCVLWPNDKARQSDGNLGSTPISATSPLVCPWTSLRVPVSPSVEHWAPWCQALSWRHRCRFALSQTISSTAGTELEPQCPSGFFLPSQNCLTVAPQGSRQEACYFVGWATWNCRTSFNLLLPS